MKGSGFGSKFKTELNYFQIFKYELNGELFSYYQTINVNGSIYTGFTISNGTNYETQTTSKKQTDSNTRSTTVFTIKLKRRHRINTYSPMQQSYNKTNKRYNQKSMISKYHQHCTDVARTKSSSQSCPANARSQNQISHAVNSTQGAIHNRTRSLE
ncbi:Hypothetical_protein [Hexamita inflata]|uniref:Hypothetical_protein n=1 Tax=Hexamita inflata TaxID=28002 RepID=A0AA86NPA5_9EUKA|nr:Hypothetical protein HINF_LOCUS11577 [Hexamita inflata]